MAGETEESSFQALSVDSGNGSSSNTTKLNLDKLRRMIKKYIEKHLYQAALFWADKVVTLSGGEDQDIFWLAQSLYCTGQYHRAAFCIKSRNLHKTDLECRYLAAKCHYAGKEYKTALEILDIRDKNAEKSKEQESTKSSDDKSVRSAIALLKGQVYEAMDNRSLAADCFREALQYDVFCYDAFYALVQHQMLSKEEEIDILQSLPFNKQCPDEEADLVKFLYETQLKKYDKPGDLTIPTELAPLQGNLDLATVLAERCYYNCDYQQCYVITSSVLNKDPFHSHCLPIHVSCLMELKKSNILFFLAHKLVDLYPESAISWFSVGCYYLLINKTDAARRYLSKATTLDRVFGPAWLMYGHSFAVENEHDQAMAAYCRASQLMKGCHLPLLYIGLEYGLSNNTKLAERFFSQALSIAPEDPFVLHELGVVAYQNQDYLTAWKYFLEALTKVRTSEQTVLPEKWEPLLNNLGHTCRKLKKYDEAIAYHQHALMLVPQNPSTYSAIGFVHSLTGRWSEAVECFHKALGVQRDDVFSSTMLTNVIEQLVREMPPCKDVPDELPTYKFSSESTPSLNVSNSTLTETSLDQSNTLSVSMDIDMDITQ